METAKAAISSFLSKDGKHDTTVHEVVNPAIQKEHVTATHHENATTAVDREVHQDHYHTSVQPIKHKEVLPEKHTHNLAGVETRHISHGNDNHIKQRLEAEKAQFKNTREVGESKHTSSTIPAVTGEHVHHHVHETIQPVIQKETIQPHVVHTTVPIHEVHQNEAKHHSASTLPAVTMEEFKHKGGVLSGRDERTDEFKGVPKTVGTTLGGVGNHHHQQNGAMKNNTTSMDHSTATAANGVHGNDGVHKKASLMDKINPKVDADGDGKAGFMK